jgi:hypothetical protein
MTLTIVLALFAILAMPVFADYDSSTAPAMEPTAPVTSSSTTMSSSTTTVTTTQYEPLVTTTIVRFYNLDPVTVSQLQTKGYTASDIAVLGNLSVRTGKPVSEIIALHDQGLSWSDIAGRYNVALVDLNSPMMVASSTEVDTFNRAFAMQQFGLSDADITALRAQGFTWGDIYMTANLAQRSHQPISQIASLRSQGLSWVDIGNRYDVAVADLTTVYIIPGRVAGVAAQVPIVAGPTAIYNRNGMVVLSDQDARLFEKMGYSWRDIAVATNIAKRTGESVDDLLRMRDSGQSWRMISLQLGLNADNMMNVSDYPFTREYFERHNF